MDHKTVEDYILSQPNAVCDYPFGEGVAVYKVLVVEKPSTAHFDAAQGGSEKQTEPYQSTVKGASQLPNAAMREDQQRLAGLAGQQAAGVRGDWKMFALMDENKTPVNLSLKCDPQLSEVLRERYETVLPGYHLNKKHWNTLILTGQLSWEEVQDLIRHSYQLVTGQ